ncbi:MAG: DNA-processing protein DprA [bacterium]
MHKHAKYFNAFNLIDGIGPVSLKKILTHFTSIKEAWLTNNSEFNNLGLMPSIINQIKKCRDKINPDLEFEKLIKENIELITIEDNNYPKLLKEIYTPPTVLYVRGNLDLNNDLSIGIVGSRLLSTYGRQVTPIISTDLAKSGITIISGLAKGIDALAHRAAVECGGKTIAVLGSGIDKKSIYPYVNKNLSEDIIASGGALVGEYPIGSSPLAQHFPQRNRIVSGLSQGILVIEASQKSGSLITAQTALDQNRDVFAIPGPIFSKTSEGANNLIKIGAKAVTDANDILQELNLSLITERKEKKEIIADNKEEELILQQLSSEPIHIDKIVNITRLSTATINSTLTIMELKGKLQNLGSGLYAIKQ